MDLFTWSTVCWKPISFTTISISFIELSYIQVETLHVRVELSDVLGEKWWQGRLWQATCWASLIRHRRLLSLLSTEALTSATTESHCHTSVFNGLWMGSAHSDVMVAILHALSDSSLMLPLTRWDMMRWREIWHPLSHTLLSVWFLIQTHRAFLIITQCG